MRLSEWRTAAPARDAASTKVLAVVEPVLQAMGAGQDPQAWVLWGDDPSARWTLLVPTQAGLLLTHVRVNVPGEGPRASAKLVRWSRVQLGELAVETQGGHRLISFNVEGQILKGADATADAIAAFALALVSAVDGRLPDVEAAFAAAAKPARRSTAAGSPRGKSASATSARGRGTAGARGASGAAAGSRSTGTARGAATARKGRASG